ncbi:MAG: hypothetical protein M3125_08845 [Gemmatimonadota bacterium]|nr:hypothetical protein [Gemmatimonadota bacterium]
MSHLHPERLAALADSEPTAAESAHLSACASCTREIAAHRRLLMLAWQERERRAAPLLDWETISEAAHDQGLIDDGASSTGARRVSGGRSPWWLQAAAAVVLMVSGGLVGLGLGRNSVTPLEENETAMSSGTITQRLASNDSVAPFRSQAEAMFVLLRAERDYRLAMTYLAGQDTVTSTPEAPDIYRARLAALDEMATVALEAVREVPTDPVMNRYYLSTLGARDATLRDLGETLPENVKLVGF